MSLYTRYPNMRVTETPSSPNGQNKNLMAAERLFSQKPVVPLTRHDRTAQTAKQIVKQASESRRSLSDALRKARLERAERITEITRNKRASKSDR